MASLIKVTLRRGLSKCTDDQIATAHGLGLFRIGKSKVLKDTKPIRGMALKIQHLIDIERYDGDDSDRDSARLRKARAKQAQT